MSKVEVCVGIDLGTTYSCVGVWQVSLHIFFTSQFLLESISDEVLIRHSESLEDCNPLLISENSILRSKSNTFFFCSVFRMTELKLLPTIRATE